MRKSNFLCNYTYQKKVSETSETFFSMGGYYFPFRLKLHAAATCLAFFFLILACFLRSVPKALLSARRSRRLMTALCCDCPQWRRFRASAGGSRVCKSLGVRRFFPIKSRESQCGRKDHIPGGMIIILCSKKSMYPMTVIILN